MTCCNQAIGLTYQRSGLADLELGLSDTEQLSAVSAVSRSPSCLAKAAAEVRCTELQTADSDVMYATTESIARLYL